MAASALSCCCHSSATAFSRLSASVFTSLSWSGEVSPSGPFAAASCQSFESEAAVGWLYVRAFFEDGSTQPVDMPLALP